MKSRAIIFDIYGTLLDIEPPPPSAAADWQRLYFETFRQNAPFDLPTFANLCAEHIDREHQLARARGILHPEIVWPCIVGDVLPGFASLEPAAQDEFVLRQIRLSHKVSLNPHAARLLPRLRAAGGWLGVASNAQAYTEHELRTAMASAGLDSNRLFEPSLCFWSYRHGFSKPDSHVFQILSTRLRGLGVPAAETLMVGDRLDNDVEPALRHGWSAWWLTEQPGGFVGGGWPALCAALAGQNE